MSCQGRLSPFTLEFRSLLAKAIYTLQGGNAMVGHTIRNRRSQTSRAATRTRVAAALLWATTAQGGNTIYVDSLEQKISATGGCSLQEAIYSANLDLNIAVDPTDLDGFITTECVSGNGDDTIVLPSGAVFRDDQRRR